MTSPTARALDSVRLRTFVQDAWDSRILPALEDTWGSSAGVAPDLDLKTGMGASPRGFESLPLRHPFQSRLAELTKDVAAEKMWALRTERWPSRPKATAC
jgi:hypothetical protein